MVFEKRGVPRCWEELVRFQDVHGKLKNVFTDVKGNWIEKLTLIRNSFPIQWRSSLLMVRKLRLVIFGIDPPWLVACQPHGDPYSHTQCNTKIKALLLKTYIWKKKKNPEQTDHLNTHEFRKKWIVPYEHILHTMWYRRRSVLVPYRFPITTTMFYATQPPPFTDDTTPPTPPTQK